MSFKFLSIYLDGLKLSTSLGQWCQIINQSQSVMDAEFFLIKEFFLKYEQLDEGLPTPSQLRSGWPKVLGASFLMQALEGSMWQGRVKKVMHGTTPEN